MLIQLKIQNLTLIEIIEINFEKGLNILTGDSGSGKSLILDALNVLFGGTNIPLNHLIRPGKDDCLIEAKFSITNQVRNWLLSNGFNDSFSELRVKRITYKKNSKILTRYSLNNLSITKKLLLELGLLLIDFAGQSDSFLFESQEDRRLIIDDLASKELKLVNLHVKNTWKKFNSLKELIADKKESFRKQEENIFAMKDMYKILEQANLNSCDEIKELEIQENMLANNYDINSSIKFILESLNNFNDEAPSISSMISQSLKQINKIVDFDLKIQKFKDELINIQSHVDTLIVEINSYLQYFECSDINLEDVQKRLFFLKNLERTFLLDLPQLIKKRDELEINMNEKSHDQEIKKLEAQLADLQTNLNSLYVIQSSQRKQIADKLQDSVLSILKNLGLENAKFLIDFERTNPSGEGIDDIKFLFSANPDQKLAPLSKVISGGEMSRFLLAIKSSISKKPNTFFMDEIDNGLSGKSLFSLVELIKDISKEKQVLCITHQPFLAASGNAHFKVKKNVINGLTFTSISKLMTKKERQKELIELIGGGFGEANNYASTLLERAAA